MPEVKYKCEDFEFALGRIKYDGIILNPEKIPDEKDAETYRQAADDLFKSLSILLTLPRKYPDISQLARNEIYNISDLSHMDSFMLKIIKSVAAVNEKNIAEHNSILNEARCNDVSDEKAEKIISRLKERGIIYESEQKKYKVTEWGEI